MPRDFYYGLSATIFFGVLCVVLDSDWVSESFSLNPASFILWSLMALALGFSLGLAINFFSSKKKEREHEEAAATVREQREQIAQNRVHIAKLESELASDRGLSVDEVRQAIADELAKDDYRKLWRPDYESSRLRFVDRENGNVAIKWVGDDDANPGVSEVTRDC